MKRKHIASFSGGRSSGYMVCKLLEEGKPLDHIIFCNTGMETPETYEFIEACNEQLFDGRLVCLEFCGTENGRGYKRVSVEQLDKEGKPFKEMIGMTKKLPNVKQRICTTELKANTKYRFMYDLYDRDEHEIYNYIGFRVDERNQKRIANARQKNYALRQRLEAGKASLKWYDDYLLLPLVDEKITSDDVMEFWKANKVAEGLSFDICDKGIRISNCMGCFYGNDAEMMMTVLKYPDIAKRWQAMEKEVNDYQHNEKKNFAYETTEKQKWVFANLGRALTPLELTEFSLHENATWKQAHEYVAGEGKNTLFRLEPLAIAGGCGDGECGTDL